MHGNWVFVVVLEAVLHPLLLTASLEKSWLSRIFGDLLSLQNPTIDLLKTAPSSTFHLSARILGRMISFD